MDLDLLCSRGHAAMAVWSRSDNENSSLVFLDYWVKCKIYIFWTVWLRSDGHHMLNAWKLGKVDFGGFNFIFHCPAKFCIYFSHRNRSHGLIWDQMVQIVTRFYTVKQPRPFI
jgi:hypothetical protein